mgnify:CR=1 FL=1|tara:strand:- start:1096 stop:1590 length:495 start_codon:yes stop_codon:yes gene_type:complete
MKNFIAIIILLNLLNSCAKPKVVNVTLPGDNKLNCTQLKNEIDDAQKIKRDADFAKTGTGGNITRLVLFWPAWAKTLHNADVAIEAANDRSYHLLKIMKNKKCSGVEKIESQIIASATYTTPVSVNKNNNESNVAEQLKILKEMYESGDLTQEEYLKAKKKVLD